jgi:tetratricopeptide (TPR) repeat protein
MQSTYGTPPRTGCVVLRVSAGAAKAGVHKGDLITEMNGTPITSGREFSAVFDLSNPPWHIQVIRPGISEPLDITIRPAPSWNFSSEPKDAIHYYLLARGEAADDPAAAIADYTQVIAVQPAFDLAYLYRAQLYADQSQTDDAEHDYAKALALSPNLGEANSFYANFQAANGDLPPTGFEVEVAIRADNCDNGFVGLNVDCAYDYAVLAEIERLAPPSEMLNAAERSLQYYGGDAYPYLEAACAYSRVPEMDLAKQRAQEYLAFPASERTEVQTATMQYLMEGAPC